MTKEPEVTAEDNAEAKLQAETMISGPVTVTAGDDTWTVSADEIVASMSFRSEAKAGVSTLVPFMDAGKLQSLLDDIAPKVLEKAKDASFTHTESRVSVVPGTNGRQLDADATTAAITAATLKATGRTVKVVTKVLEPGLTTAEAKAMGITTKLNSYSTTYACDGDRQANVKLATKNGTDVFLAPGEAYDFDKQTVEGRRQINSTERLDYANGKSILDEKTSSAAASVRCPPRCSTQSPEAPPASRSQSGITTRCSSPIIRWAAMPPSPWGARTCAS